jgi:hypothetical protein
MLKITESEIKAASLKFVKERFGLTKLSSTENYGDVDLKSHRISYEAGIKDTLIKIGYTKGRKCYTKNDEL